MRTGMSIAAVVHAVCLAEERILTQAYNNSDCEDAAVWRQLRTSRQWYIHDITQLRKSLAVIEAWPPHVSRRIKPTLRAELRELKRKLRIAVDAPRRSK